MYRIVAVVRSDVSEKHRLCLQDENERVFISMMVSTLKMEATFSQKCRFLQDPHGKTSRKTTFFKVTAVKTSNLTNRMPVSGMLRRVALLRTDVRPKHQFLQEPQSVTSQKTALFIVTAVQNL
jgi:hypothetical protein